nr:unnamed protein product [Digitaria exilis]
MDSTTDVDLRDLNLNAAATVDDAESSSTAARQQQEQSEEENAAGAEDDEEAAAVDELMDDFEADEDNARWAAFQAIISPKKKQDQVLRYGGARPLWAVASGALPAGGAPPCARCGGARRFELQLMPQLLHFFHVEACDPDPVDWATVVVYTCARSCGGGGSGYVEEFAWVQRLPWRDDAAN